MDRDKINIQITSDNMEVTESMKALVNKKITKIIKRISEGTPEDLVDLRVVLNKGDEEGTFESKMVLKLGSFKVVGSGNEYTLESSIIDAVEDGLRTFEKKASEQKSGWQEQRKMKTYPTE